MNDNHSKVNSPLEFEEDLNQALLSMSDSIEKIDLQLNFCCLNKISQWNTVSPIAKRALKLSEEENYEEGKGLALLEIGYQQWFRDEFENAFNNLSESAKILKNTKNQFKYSRTIAVKSSILWGKGKRNEAISDIFDALRHVRKYGDNSSALWLEWFLGIFYFDLKDYKNAEEQYRKALAIIEIAKENTRDAYAYCLVGYGGVLLKNQKPKEAIHYYLKAKEFTKENKLWMQEARTLFELGNYYFAKEETALAKSYHEKSYLIRKEKNTKPALISSLLSLVKLEKNEALDKAFSYAKEALELAKTIDSKVKILNCHQVLAELYELKSDFKQSYFHLKEFNSTNQQLSGGVKTSELKQLESDFSSELLKREAELLTLQNDELKTAYKEISDSIDYAKKIQTALLPAADLVNQYIPCSFLVFKPKDIVAGDFYWIENVGKTVLFAVADCTGHGVPGALVSVICINALNRAVREFQLIDPAEILNKVRQIVKSEFSKSGEKVRDGMDISLCVLHLESLELRYAGANRPLWLIRKNTKILEEVKGDKFPIGDYPTIESFTTCSIQLNSGDQLYLSTDGYSDQFGGEKNKKYMTSRFKGNLIEHSQELMNFQKMALINNFRKWKGEQNQIDDICILGVRIQEPISTR